MGYIVPNPPPMPRPNTPPGGQKPQSVKKKETPTNCKNCSAKLRADICDYCGTVY